MTRYLLVSRSAEYETRLRRLFRARLQTLPGEYLTFGVDEAVDRVRETPAIALLGPLLTLDETKSLSVALGEQHPGIGVVVVREQRSDLEDWVEEVGMHAVLSPEATDAATESLIGRLDEWLVTAGRAVPPETTDDVADPSDGEATISLVDLRIEPEATSAEPPAAEAVVEASPEAVAEPAEPEWTLPDVEGVRTEVIAVAAPKGGQGKTTMAVNLATGLAEVAPHSVVLIDADLQFGDIANVLDLTATRGLVEAVDAADDEVLIKTLLIRHVDDFFVIPAPRSPELADTIDPHRMGALIDRLATMFRYVVIDTTPGLGEHTLTALEHATDGIFVTSLTVASLRALRTEFELLVALGLLPQNRHIVLNAVEKNTGLVVADAEPIIGAAPDIVVPRSSGVLLAANAGVPLIHNDPRDSAAKAVRTLVQRIEPTAYPTRRRIHRRRRSQ
ncbi:AAA family ATPase [Agromyces sp. H66]|uniref:AAA family ATPase n=1 Tax=Agromyces sp. H66 TaxID=2529859 RepID=UPI0010AAE79D|nr:AAA family ATPase [Agromyces sp. H66]